MNMERGTLTIQYMTCNKQKLSLNLSRFWTLTAIQKRSSKIKMMHMIVLLMLNTEPLTVWKMFCRPTSKFSNIVWQNGKPPPDNPACGFDNELCEWLENGKMNMARW